MMVNFLKMAVFFIAAFQGMHAAEAIAPAQCEEQVHLSFDNREWEQGYADSNDDASIIEFVLKGENVDNWSELVTIQRFPPLKATVEQYYQLFVENLSQAISPEEAHADIISQNQDSILFEWWVEGNGPNVQHEWFKLIKTPNSTLVIRYTTKNMADVEKARAVWQPILEDASYSLEGNCS